METKVNRTLTRPKTQFGGSYQDVRQRLWRGIGGDQSAVKDCGLGQLEQKGSWV